MTQQTTLSDTSITRQEATEVEATAAQRLYYVDNLRTALIAVVIVGHVAASYGAVGEWYRSDEGEVSVFYYATAAILLAVGASFVLGLLFMLAAYFTPPAYDRKGGARFVTDRLKRLGIPLLLFALVLNPLTLFIVENNEGFGPGWNWPEFYANNLLHAAPGVMWFVEALLIFSLCYAAWRRFVHPAPPAQPRPAPGNRAIALFALAIGVATFVVRIWWPVGFWWEPPHLELAHFPQYIAFFAAGILAYQGRWLVSYDKRQARPWRWVAMVMLLMLPALVVAAGALEGELDPAGAGGVTWLSLAYSLWEGFMGVAMVIIVLVWARSRFNRQGRLLRAMSASSYAAYLLHPLIVVSLTVALSGIRMDLNLKFVLVAPVAVALCFAAAYGLRQLPGMKSIL